MSFAQILNQFSPADFHPPFYYFALKTWIDVFGANEVGARSLSIILGLATIFVVYLIGKTIKNRKVGLLSAALLATSGLHVYYSQEARMYILSTFLVALLVYLFLKLQKEAKNWQWILFSLILALNSLTDYLPNLIIPVFWFYALIVKKNASWWKKFILSHLVLVFAWVFWFPTFLVQLGAGLAVKANAPPWWDVLGRTTLKQVLLIPVKFMIGRISFFNKEVYALVMGVLAVFFGFLIVKATKFFKSTKIIWIWLLIPVVVSALMGFRVSVFSYFRLIFVLPAFCLLIALGLENLKKKWFVTALFFVLAINLSMTSIYLFNPRFHRENWRGLLSFIEKESVGKKTITLFVADSQMEAYKYYSKDAKIAGPTGLSEGLDLIWLMRYVQPMFDPEDKLRQEVEELGYQKTGEFDFNKVVVWRYEK
jgi:uncharacterized membrane protein